MFFKKGTVMIYNVTEKTFRLSETIEYTSYGIEVKDDKPGKVICTVHDIFLDKQQAEQCVCLFNREALEIVHFSEAIECVLTDSDFFLSDK